MEKLVSPLKLLRMSISYVYDLEVFGPKLVPLRISKGLSQQDFADSLKVSLDVVESWENGLVEVDLTNALRGKICKVFGLTLLEFNRHFEAQKEYDNPPVHNRRSTDRSN
jgi:transcriptional regulator with XRE-family HTH domain